MEEPADKVKKCDFYQSRDPVIVGAGLNAGIAMISDQTRSARPWNLRQSPISYAKDVFYAECGNRERFDSYGTSGENLYLEIDESVLERAAGMCSVSNGTILDFLKRSRSKHEKQLIRSKFEVCRYVCT